MIPFAALLTAGVADSLWRIKIGKPVVTTQGIGRLPKLAARHATAAVTLASMATFTYVTAPNWTDNVRTQMSSDMTLPWRQATAWAIANVPKDAVVVTDNLVWPELARNGFSNPNWNFKVDLDPEVKELVVPRGWTDIDYLILGPMTDRAKKDMPTVVTAMENSEKVMTFGAGTLAVYKVKK